MGVFGLFFVKYWGFGEKIQKIDEKLHIDQKK
jgi:hypothetical protein